MPIQIQGNGGVAAEVSATHRALRVEGRSLDYSTLGHYLLSTQIGTSGAPIAAGLAANSELLQFRWTDATRLAVITHIRLTGAYQLTAFTAGAGLFTVTAARAFTADGTGGAVATLTGNNQKQRTNMGTSVAAVRVATTAALGAGTKTLDAAPFGAYTKFIPAAINSQLWEPIDLFNPEIANGEAPLILATNEGFALRATVPATGTWVMGVEIQWAEVDAY